MTLGKSVCAGDPDPRPPSIEQSLINSHTLFPSLPPSLPPSSSLSARCQIWPVLSSLTVPDNLPLSSRSASVSLSVDERETLLISNSGAWAIVGYYCALVANDRTGVCLGVRAADSQI